MNLVKLIMDQLSGEGFEQLGSLLGTDAESTELAATAAVPSLLSALAGTASTSDGASKLTSLLSGLDTSALGNISQLLGGNAGSLLNKGNSMLGSLFGDSMVSGIAGAVSRFTGLNSGIVKTLLAYLLPMVLGKVAAQWKNQGGNSQALKSLFADQRDNIANATPAGFSLSDIPGLSGARPATFNPNRKVEAEPVSTGSPMSWLLPLALALLGGFFLWQFLARPRAQDVAVERPVRPADPVVAMKPVVPEATAPLALADVRSQIGDLFKSLDTSLAEIRDPASAERAKPALEELDTKIDSMSQLLTNLPAASATMLRPLITEQVHGVIDKANAALATIGISPEVRALLEQIVAKISKWISADTR